MPFIQRWLVECGRCQMVMDGEGDRCWDWQDYARSFRSRTEALEGATEEGWLDGYTGERAPCTCMDSPQETHQMGCRVNIPLLNPICLKCQDYDK